MDPDREQFDWGNDPAALTELRKTWPHAVHLLDAGLLRCSYPMWSIRPFEGRYITDFHNHEMHRYVCGAPVVTALSAYCPACSRRLHGQARASAGAVARARADNRATWDPATGRIQHAKFKDSQ